MKKMTRSIALLMFAVFSLSALTASNASETVNEISFDSIDIEGYWKRSKDGLTVKVHGVHIWKDGGRGIMTDGGEGGFRNTALQDKIRNIEYKGNGVWSCENLWGRKTNGVVSYYFKRNKEIKMNEDKQSFRLDGNLWNRVN